MSHITTSQLEISDLPALAAAARSLGLEIIKDQKTFLWYAGNRAACDHAIRVHGNSEAYEIGICRKENGRYEMKFDSWAGGRGLMAKTGPGLSRLKQEYAYQTAARRLQAQGYKVNRTIDAAGRLHVTATR